MSEESALPLERLATLEANRDNDVRRIARVETAVDRIVLAGWVIAGGVIVQTINAVWHRAP